LDISLIMKGKVERENIVSNVGLKTEYGKGIQKPKDMESFEMVGDKQHLQIVSMYADEGKGYNIIAEELGRSSRTPYTHVHEHNDVVKRSSFCVICCRAGGKYQN
jgi:hypothetical protein